MIIIYTIYSIYIIMMMIVIAQVQELIKANIQRSKVIQDQVTVININIIITVINSNSTGRRITLEWSPSAICTTGVARNLTESCS